MLLDGWALLLDKWALHTVMLGISVSARQCNLDFNAIGSPWMSRVSSTPIVYLSSRSVSIYSLVIARAWPLLCGLQPNTLVLRFIGSMRRRGSGNPGGQQAKRHCQRVCNQGSWLWRAAESPSPGYRHCHWSRVHCQGSWHAN